MSFHDADRLRRAAIADVHPAGEDPPGSGHELRDVRVGPAAKGTTHRSPEHADTSDHDDYDDSEVSGQRKRLVLKIRDRRIDDAFHRPRVKDRSGTHAKPGAAATHSVTGRRVPSIAIRAAVATVTTFGIQAPAAACSTPL